LAKRTSIFRPSLQPTFDHEKPTKPTAKRTPVFEEMRLPFPQRTPTFRELHFRFAFLAASFFLHVAQLSGELSFPNSSPSPPNIAQRPQSESPFS
jgi:hypothetical protein